MLCCDISTCVSSQRAEPPILIVPAETLIFSYKSMFLHCFEPHVCLNTVVALTLVIAHVILCPIPLINVSLRKQDTVTPQPGSMHGNPNHDFFIALPCF